MVWLLVGLVFIVIAGFVAWSLLRAADLPARTDAAWLPAELRDARLLWTEETFHHEGDISMTVRVDRVYRTRDGRLTLIEFKRRAAHRTYRSDVVELSAQRYVLQKVGHAVDRRAYVVLVSPDGGSARALLVELQDAEQIERRAARYVELVSGARAPGRCIHTTICRGCGHRSICPK